MTAADALRRLLADVRDGRAARLPHDAALPLSRLTCSDLDYLERLALDGLAGEEEHVLVGWTSKLWHKSSGWWTCAACNYGNVNDARECWNCRRPLRVQSDEPKIANGDGGDFFCPKCEAFSQWGTSNSTGPRDTWVGHCYGTPGVSCGFLWPRTDDAKYFKAKPTEDGQP